MSNPAPQASGFPVSVKGVLIIRDRVLLLHNERNEWELPGGRIEIGESPERCVAREIAEETRCRVRTGPILDSWLYHIAAARKHVFIVTYGCYPESDDALMRSDEHDDMGLFAEREVCDLQMPEGYKRSIATWFLAVAGAE